VVFGVWTAWGTAKRSQISRDIVREWPKYVLIESRDHFRFPTMSGLPTGLGWPRVGRPTGETQGHAVPCRKRRGLEGASWHIPRAISCCRTLAKKRRSRSPGRCLFSSCVSAGHRAESFGLPEPQKAGSAARYCDRTRIWAAAGAKKKPFLAHYLGRAQWDRNERR